MAFQMDDMPNELLCKILELLDNEEKFKVRVVCQKWRNQIDENVPFHLVITDANYNQILEKFGTSRQVKTISINNYQRENVPINNLTFLKGLSVRRKVNKVAVADILSRAVNLNILHLNVHHGKESAKLQQTTSLASYPALRNIKQLCVGYSFSYFSTWSGRAWNEFLYGEMPNVERLIIELYLNIPPPQGFDFFRLAAGMPNLQEFIMKIWSHVNGRQLSSPGDVQPLTSEISRGLASLKLTKVDATIYEKDEEVWKALLAGQCQVKELYLYVESKVIRGFPVSIILPVLHKSKGSLDTIVLDIDTARNGDVDVEIFSTLKFLRKLVLEAWPKQEGAEAAVLANISNCSTVVSETLEELSVVGFKFTEEDVINVIKNIPNDKLDQIRIGPEFASVWTDFENRLEEMGIVRYGHSSKCPSKYRSWSSNATKVYIGATLELQHDYEFIGLLKSDYSKRVKDVTLKRQTLTVESRYMWSFSKLSHVSIFNADSKENCFTKSQYAHV